MPSYAAVLREVAYEQERSAAVLAGYPAMAQVSASCRARAAQLLSLAATLDRITPELVSNLALADTGAINLAAMLLRVIARGPAREEVSE